ncbi:phosphomannose isomerase type II C-terminal cupin domain [Patescibacteria group bacterium]
MLKLYFFEIMIFVTKKPWGKFETFCSNQEVTVKILNLNPGGKISLQFHHNRSEFWRVLKGGGKVTVGDRVIDSSVGDEFKIDKEVVHRIEAGEEGIEILEISAGDFDEDDIVRIKDDYQRI